jgi:hypothetical protein
MMRRLRPMLLVFVGVLVLASAASAKVLRVGTYRGVRGQFSSVQAAVNAAKPGDWILIAPGDYHEHGVPGASEPAGVLIRTARLYVRGMNRNSVIIDGTKPGAAPCSSRRQDQMVTRRGRNGVEVFKANDVSIENLTVCNFLTSARGQEGNEIWWNGGDSSGKIGMGPWWGNYLTATSTFSKGVSPPYGAYGIFVSNSRGPGVVDHSYASNMGDSSYYVGACPDCNAVIRHARGQDSALGFSGTNAGGHLIIENSEFDHNKTGPTTNSQNNDDAPSPQSGRCPHSAPGPLGNGICDIWRDNLIHDNNNPNVPGNGVNGLAGEVPVGVGVVLAGTQYVDLYHNRIYNNSAWGVTVLDFPDQESPPPIAHCRGGIYLVAPPAKNPLCYYRSFGNVVEGNSFAHNGSFGNPTNGDIALYAKEHNPGNCFRANTGPGSLSTTPLSIQTSPFNPCGQGNGSTEPAAITQIACALKLAPCPAGTNYPQPSRTFGLRMPRPQTTMPNPCAGVPANPWCVSPADNKHPTGDRTSGLG